MLHWQDTQAFMVLLSTFVHPVKTPTVCLGPGIMTHLAATPVRFRSQEALWESDPAGEGGWGGVAGRVDPAHLHFQGMRAAFWEVTTGWTGSLSRQAKH